MIMFLCDDDVFSRTRGPGCAPRHSPFSWRSSLAGTALAAQAPAGHLHLEALTFTAAH